MLDPSLDRLKLLFVGPDFPHPRSPSAAGQIGHHYLELLRERDDPIALTWVDVDEVPFYPRVKKLQQFVIPLFPAQEANPKPTGGGLIAFLRWIKNCWYIGQLAYRTALATDIDVVQVSDLRVLPPIKKRSFLPLVYDCTGIPTEMARRRFEMTRSRPRRLWYWASWKVILFLEKRLLRRIDVILVRSREDRDRLRELYPQMEAEILIIPLLTSRGTDTQDDPLAGRRAPHMQEPSLFFGGNLERLVNVEDFLWFCENVLPRIRSRRPDLVLHGLSKDLPRRVRKLVKRDAQITLHDDYLRLREYLRAASVVVCPVLAGGDAAANVFMALAEGRPTVTTSLGNRPVGAEPGRDLIVKDDPIEFADAVIELLDDASLRTKLGQKARRFADERYETAGLQVMLQELYGRLAEEALQSTFGDTSHPAPSGAEVRKPPAARIADCRSPVAD